MKKVLLIGLILAICILAFPQGVLAATSGDTANVVANIEDKCEVTSTFNTPALGWNLARNAPNDLSDAITVTVDSSSPWGLVASDEKTVALGKGYMTASDGTKMKTAFVFAGTGLETPNPLFDPGQTPQTKTTYNWAVGQPTIWSDNAALEYKIVITFTLTAS